MSTNALRAVRGVSRVADAPRFKSLPPLSLYIHVPWCVRKCPYCDFNSHETRGELPEDAYIAALTADLDQALPLIWGRRVYTVFFGGGTPSLLSAEAVGRVLSAVRARLSLVADAEITLEANPGTVETRKFREFAAAGVNRLSLGIQSFDRGMLAALGRIHDDVQAHRAAETVREHFENFNLDLMYALPGQTPDRAKADLAQALDYKPPHLSVYHLTIEPNTYFHRYPPALPDGDAAAEMGESLGELLVLAGYEHYETSAYAQPRKLSRHNLNYWLFGDYLGIGAGAHSKISFADRVVRQARYRQPREYMSRAQTGNAVQIENTVHPEDLVFEFMMNALRLNGGFPLSMIEERAGVPLLAALAELDEAERRGFVVRDHERVQPTDLGRRFLNDALQIFLRDRK